MASVDFGAFFCARAQAAGRGVSTMQRMFVHLRLHTEFSVVDGTNRVDEIVKAAATDGQSALAITVGATTAVGTAVTGLFDLAWGAAELGVFADGPLAPRAGALQHIATHHGHGAVLDDGVALVAVMHADAEKAVIFPVAHAPKRIVLPVAMRLWTLHDSDLWIVEITRQCF